MKTLVTFRLAAIAALAMAAAPALAAEPIVLDLWPGKPPGEVKELPPEADQTKPEDRLVAGRRVTRLGNVSRPQLAVYLPPPDKAVGAAVVICPGGGHSILAYDLEGTEVAEWLNTLGVTGIVLKYRVPARNPAQRWSAAVQDAQRAMSLVRARANEWKLDPRRIGICGFSAGGETAGLTSLFAERTYEPVDDADKQPTRPDFALLIYAGGLADQAGTALREYVKPTKDAPPMFLVHAFDDRVSAANSLLLANGLKSAGGTAEVHVYATGGHGYGLRTTADAVTRWPERAAQWLRERSLLDRQP